MPQPRNGAGTAGMVLGIIGLVLGFVPVFGWLAIVIALVGLPLSCVGRSRARNGEATNRGQAEAGMVCNIIALVLTILAAIAMAAMAGAGYY